MALSRIGVSPSLESAEFAYGSRNLLTRLDRPSPVLFVGKYSNSFQRECLGVRCKLSRKDVTSVRPEGNGQSVLLVSIDEEPGHVARFKISDFKIINHVSVGLGARVRGNEFVYDLL